MSGASFVQPAADAAEARARRDEPEVRALAQALEDAVSRCAADPEGQALDEKPVLKAVRLLNGYLSGEHGPDSVRAGFRQALYRLADLRETRAGFLLADGLTLLWIDLYPEAADTALGVSDPLRAPHVYLDGQQATARARARWARVAPRPGRVVPRPALPVVEPERAPRPSKRYASGEEW